VREVYSISSIATNSSFARFAPADGGAELDLARTKKLLEVEHMKWAFVSRQGVEL